MGMTIRPPAELPTYNGSKTITGSLTIGSDAVLVNEAAAVLAQRNGTNPQTFRAYNTFTDASNYERLGLNWSTNSLIIQTEQAGTGSARSVTIGTTGSASLILATNTNNKWIMSSAGNMAAGGNFNLWNGASALATTATAGFLGVNSCAGPPTGVPASIPTGQIPLVYDSTNNKLYAYNGAWKAVTLA